MQSRKEGPISSTLKEYWEHRLATADLGTVGYAGLGRRYNGWLYRVRRSVFRRTVRGLGLQLPETTLLDVGSGTGFYVGEWRALGATRITASDFTDAAVAYLQRVFPDVAVRQLDITSDAFPIPPESYDVVSAMDVLFHITDDAAYRRALGNIAASLRPGGVFVFSENFVSGTQAGAAHHRSRSRNELDQWLGDAGFDVLTRRPMFVLMNEPVDNASRAQEALWSGIRRVASRHELLGFTAGAALFPIESALVRTVDDGPSTEIAVCRRRAA